MATEKDRLGQKLHDAELLEQIRQRLTSALHCLQCGKTLQSKSLGKTRAFACPDGHGAWIDEATLGAISAS